VTELSDKIQSYVGSLFGKENLNKFIEYINFSPSQFIRVNSLKTTPEKIIKVLSNKYGIKTERVPGLQNTLKVIKGNEIKLEVGGGMCQIGTTLFRMAMNSGLDITERRNHSYRVVYYEPAGTDATIYDPAPDYKFINDTKNYVLIQTRIEGDDLYFDFWGTNDGRQPQQSDPVIYNIVSPGPKQFIETEDLKPGETKCVESAHNGADAYFDYTVTYADGTLKERRFPSHYIPWPAKCLVGIEPQTATSTEVIIEE